MASRQEPAVRADFLYEPAHPPTITPGMTVAQYRRQRAKRARCGRRGRPRR
jgi:hypothetical protein